MCHPTRGLGRGDVGDRASSPGASRIFSIVLQMQQPSIPLHSAKLARETCPTLLLSKIPGQRSVAISFEVQAESICDEFCLACIMISSRLETE